MGHVVEVARDLVKNAGPSVLSAVVRQANQLVTICFIAALDDKYLLGAVGLGAMAQNVFGFSLGQGLNSALGTLVSQSNGAERHDVSAVHLRRAQLVSLSLSLPCMLALLFAEEFFLLVGIEAKSAHYAGLYVRGSVISIPFVFLTSATQGFLRAVKQPNPQFYVSVVAACVHPLWCMLFLRLLKWGPFGAGCTLAASNIVSYLLITGYVALYRPGACRQAWHVLPWPRKSSQGSTGGAAATAEEVTAGGLGTYLRVACNSGMLMWSEWWVYELMSLLAGLCGADALAAHTAVCNLLLVMFMVPAALGGSTCSLVGNAIGEQNISKARTTIWLAFSCMGVGFTVVGCLVFLVRSPLAALFSSNPETQDTIARLVLILGPFLLVDSLQTVIEGALSGLELQRLATPVKLSSMLGVRLLGAYILGIVLHFGVVGVWCASLAGMVVTLVAYLVVLRSVSYEDVASRAQQRLAQPLQEPGPGAEG